MNDNNLLGKLIDRVKRETGWSDELIAARATSAGHPASKQNIGKIRNQGLESISSKQLDMLAAGLGIDPVIIARAAVATMGYPRILEAESDLGAAVRNSLDLSARDKAILNAVIEAMHANESEQRDGNVQQDSPEVLRFRARGAALDGDARAGQKSREDYFRSLAGFTDEEVTRRIEADRKEWADRGEENQDPEPAR